MIKIKIIKAGEFRREFEENWRNTGPTYLLRGLVHLEFEDGDIVFGPVEIPFSSEDRATKVLNKFYGPGTEGQ